MSCVTDYFLDHEQSPLKLIFKVWKSKCRVNFENYSVLTYPVKISNSYKIR